MLTFAIVIVGSISVDGFFQPEASASGRTAPTVGLFPLWENTGVVLGHGRFALATNQLGAGMGDRAQISVNPMRFAFRTPNLGFKAALLSTKQLRLAASADLIWLLPGASDAFSTSNISSRISEGRTDKFIAPLAVSSSFALAQTVTIHLTVTGLVTYARLPDAWLGLSGVCEWRPLLHHSISLHLTEVGFWRHDFVQFGGSYRFQQGIFEARLGVSYQLLADGSILMPAFSVGIEL